MVTLFLVFSWYKYLWEPELKVPDACVEPLLATSFIELLSFVNCYRKQVVPFFSPALLFDPVCVSHSVTSDSLQTPWTAAYQPPLSMGFPRQQYWSGLPCPPPGDLPNPRVQIQVSCIAGRFFIIWSTREALLDHSPLSGIEGSLWY